MIKPIEYTYDEEGNKVVKKVKINNTIYICEPPGVISLDNHPDLIQKILKLKLSENTKRPNLFKYGSQHNRDHS